MKQLLIIAFTLLTFVSFSQSSLNNLRVIDGVFVREHYNQRKPINYAPEVEINMMWSKRIWRTIDLREKINHTFYYPIEPTSNLRNLITVMRDGICSGSLTAYEPLSDEFLTAYRPVEACSVGENTDTLFLPDKDGSPIPTPIFDPFPTHNVMRLRIKEDWYFNNKRSTMQARIIGICPVEQVYDEYGEYKGERPLYWVYMPEFRFHLAQAPAANPHSEVERRTYDELFQKRKFSSYITKESNVFTRKISEYKQDLDALLEGQQIEKTIFDYEQDLWEY